MGKGIEALVESRLAAMSNDRDRLTKAWAPHINSVEGYFEKQGKSITSNDKRNIARCLENALLEGGIKSRSSIFETTDSSAIQFLGIQLPVIAALLPSLVLNKLAVTQALDRRSGAVFYLDVKYGTSKGSVTAAENMMDAKLGHNQTEGGRQYASVRVTGEALAATTTGTLGYFPVVTGTAVITDGTTGEVYTVASTDGTTDTLTGTTSGDAGSIVLATGVWTVDTTLYAGSTIDYKYDWQTGGVGGSTTSNVPVSKSYSYVPSSSSLKYYSSPSSVSKSSKISSTSSSSSNKLISVTPRYSSSKSSSKSYSSIIPSSSYFSSSSRRSYKPPKMPGVYQGKGFKQPKKTSGTFKVFGRRFGKFRIVGISRTERGAFKLGKTFASKSLGATFKVPKSKVTKITGFRTKITKKGTLFIEPRKRRLKKGGKEVQEIQIFKQAKKKKKKGGKKK